MTKLSPCTGETGRSEDKSRRCNQIQEMEKKERPASLTRCEARAEKKKGGEGGDRQRLENDQSGESRKVRREVGLNVSLMRGWKKTS